MLWQYPEFDAARCPDFTGYETFQFELEHHLVHGWWRNAKESL